MVGVRSGERRATLFTGVAHMLVIVLIICLISAVMGVNNAVAMRQRITAAQAVKELVSKLSYEKGTRFKTSIMKIDVKKDGNRFPKEMLGKEFYFLEDDQAEDLAPVYYVETHGTGLIIKQSEEVYSRLSPTRRTDLKLSKKQAVEIVGKRLGKLISKFDSIRTSKVELLDYTDKRGKCYSVGLLNKSDKLRHFFDVNVYSGTVYDSFNEP